LQSVLFRPLVVVPVFNCENSIESVFIDLFKNLDESISVLFIDNKSSDNTVSILMSLIVKQPDAKFQILENRSNLGLGGSQKTAFNFGRNNGFSHLIVFHGDGQPSGKDLSLFLSMLRTSGCDAILGSRFMADSNRINYSRVRTLGNVIFNFLFSIRYRRRVYDIGSGLNAYNLSIYREIDGFPDDLSFNSYLLAYQLRSKENIIWTPISWKNSEAGSNLKMLTIGFKCLKALVT
jgi:glycosyltransferase involved in cell wall biosynthesis